MSDNMKEAAIKNPDMAGEKHFSPSSPATGLL